MLFSPFWTALSCGWCGLHPVGSDLLAAHVHQKTTIKSESLCFTVLHPGRLPVQSNMYLAMYLEICHFTPVCMILSDFHYM